MLNSNDMSSLAQAKVKGDLPLLKHLDLSCNGLFLSEFKCLFEGPSYWSELLTLDIRQFLPSRKEDKVIDYINEIVSLGYLCSLKKLGINYLENRDVRWKNLEKLILCECKDDALRNIANAVRSGLLPALTTLCIRYIEGYDADIVRSFSQ